MLGTHHERVETPAEAGPAGVGGLPVACAGWAAGGAVAVQGAAHGVARGQPTRRAGRGGKGGHNVARRNQWTSGHSSRRPCPKPELPVAGRASSEPHLRQPVEWIDLGGRGGRGTHNLYAGGTPQLVLSVLSVQS